MHMFLLLELSLYEEVFASHGGVQACTIEAIIAGKRTASDCKFVNKAFIYAYQALKCRVVAAESQTTMLKINHSGYF